MDGDNAEDVIESIYVMYENNNLDLLTFMKIAELLDFELEEEFFDSLNDNERKKAF